MRLLLIAVLLGLISSPSMATGHCAPWEDYVEALAETYLEVPTAIGQLFNGNVLTLLAAENGSWSMLATNAQGIACMVASGREWKEIPRTDFPTKGEDISI